jgi:hypothetical protein
VAGRLAQNGPCSNFDNIFHARFRDLSIQMTSQARRAQAEQAFKSALTDLQQALPSKIQESLAKISFPTIDDTAPIDSQASRMEAAIIPLINEIQNSHNGKSKSRKVRSVATGWFKASWPFARLILGVAQSGSSVISTPRSLLTVTDNGIESIRPCLRRTYRTFGCIIPASYSQYLLLQNVYEAAGRKDKILEVFNNLSFQLGRIKTEQLSSQLEPSQVDEIHGAAFNMSSAILQYLAISIDYFKHGLTSTLFRFHSNTRKHI